MTRYPYGGAGLKGTLTDNGDGTATFTMKTLNAGDTVSIGGKNYTIGGEEASKRYYFQFILVKKYFSVNQR